MPVVRPLSRERMDKGFTPTAALGWPVSIGLGLVSGHAGFCGVAITLAASLLRSMGLV